MRTLLAAVCLALALGRPALAGNKTAGYITVLGDADDYSSASSGQAAGVSVVQGGLSPVAHELSVAGGIASVLESGFYSRLVSSPAAFAYSPDGVSSYTVVYGTAAEPAGTTYDLFVSTWALAEPYMVFYSTDQNGYPVESLAPNTSYYSFVVANYMEGDYSFPASTTAVTLAVVPSTGVLTLSDAGHNTLSLSFAGYQDTPPPQIQGWTSPAAQLPRPLYGEASVVYGTYVYVSGGFDGVYFSSAVFMAPVAQDGTLGSWQTAGYMPVGLYGHQMVAARGRLYVLGGYASDGSRADVWSADISSSGATGPWEREASLPAPAYFHAAALAGDRIYVSGGYSSGSGVLDGLEYADLSDDGALQAWVTTSTLPAPRYAHSMTLLPGELVIAGGKDGVSARSEVWTYNLASGHWSDYAPLPSPRYGHQAAAAGTRLYVIGGNNGYTAQAQIFQTTVTPEGLSPWEGVAPLPGPRQFAAAELAGSRLYLFGGSSGASPLSDEVCATVPGAGYLVQAAESADFSSGLRSSGWNSSPAADFGGLRPDTTYYFRAKARNWTGVETDYSLSGSTITYAAIPATAPWFGVWVDSATAAWDPAGNPSGTLYELVRSTSPDFSGPAAFTASGSSLTLTGLSQSTTYYAKVRVLDAAGRASRFAALPPVRTTFDPTLDVDSPTINDQQPDFQGWKSTNTFLCHIYFADVGASGLSKFQLQVSTVPGHPFTPWMDAVTAINQPSYVVPWTIPETVWNSMLDGASNYISVRVYDNASPPNYTVLSDTFSVLKDAVPPVVVSTYSVSAAWFADYPGNATGVSFSDGFSGLQKAQFSVSTNKGFADGNVIPWTDIGSLAAGATVYAPALSYSFNQLANATSNYFSLRAVDVAGSTATLLDAFAVAKNVSGPVVYISSPSAMYLSTFTAVSGTTAETNAHPVLGTEVYLRDLYTGLYYGGSAFLSASVVWLDASQQASSFTLTFNGLPLVDGRQYAVVARSSDSAGDYSQVFDTRTFTFDSAPPSAALLYPADGASVPSAVSISGTAADAVSGVTAVQAALQRLSDGKWWNGALSSWGSGPVPLLAGTTEFWTWTFPPYLRDSLVDGASYYATVRAFDAATPPNAGEFFVSGATFTYLDATPPPATYSLAASQGSYGGAVALLWRSAGDNGASGYLLSGAYKVAYSTYSGAVVSTATAQISITTSAVTAGSTQQFTVNSLNPGVTCYFTLWTQDDAGNWSPPSNEASSLPGTAGSGALSGTVLDASTQPITGVLVQAFGQTGALEGSDYTNAFGRYSIPGLNSLYLTVRAAWTAADIESSVSKDSVLNGSSGVDFRLSVAYQLASISGIIPSAYLPASVPRTAGARYTTREVSSSEGSRPFVEVYSRGRRIGAAFTDSSGAFTVPNLLPGTYGLRVFNGTAFSRMQTVTLSPGQRLVFTPKFDLFDKSGVFAYPNPARTLVNFRFAPAAASFTAVVQVFDITGRLVKTLHSYSAAPPAVGGWIMTWDVARDGIAPGIYLYVLRVRDVSTGAAGEAVKKFAIIR